MASRSQEAIETLESAAAEMGPVTLCGLALRPEHGGYTGSKLVWVNYLSKSERVVLRGVSLRELAWQRRRFHCRQRLTRLHQLADRRGYRGDLPTHPEAQVRRLGRFDRAGRRHRLADNAKAGGTQPEGDPGLRPRP